MTIQKRNAHQIEKMRKQKASHHNRVKNITKHFNKISTTRKRKKSDLSTNTLHRVTRRHTTTKDEPTDDPT